MLVVSVPAPSSRSADSSERSPAATAGQAPAHGSWSCPRAQLQKPLTQRWDCAPERLCCSQSAERQGYSETGTACVRKGFGVG